MSAEGRDGEARSLLARKAGQAHNHKLDKSQISKWIYLHGIQCCITRNPYFHGGGGKHNQQEVLHLSEEKVTNCEPSLQTSRDCTAVFAFA